MCSPQWLNSTMIGKLNFNYYFFLFCFNLSSVIWNRQLSGALNRVPQNFYDRMWTVLERTPAGLKVSGYHLPQVWKRDYYYSFFIHLLFYPATNFIRYDGIWTELLSAGWVDAQQDRRSSLPANHRRGLITLINFNFWKKKNCSNFHKINYYYSYIHFWGSFRRHSW